MPFGISPTKLFNVIVIAVAIACLAAFLYQVRESGANEERVKNLTDKVAELESVLQSERALRVADQAAIRERDAKIEAINRKHAEVVTDLESELIKARQTDECIDKYIPQRIQKDIFGS